MTTTTDHQDPTSTEPIGELEAAPSTPDTADAAPDTVVADALPIRRSRRPLILGGVALAVVAAGAATWLLLADATDEAGDAEAAPVTIQAVSAEIRDLIEFTELDATLAYGESFAIGPRTDGTLTDITDDGTLVERGDVIWEVNEQPTVLFYGATPLYRELSSGAEGDDVRMVEENLAALGYTNDGAMTVDDVYDADTIAAVEAWQDDMDLEATGSVSIADAQVEPGPIQIDTTSARSGDTVRAGTPIVTASLVQSTSVVLATADGLVTEAPSVGDRIETGAALYEVDTVPVPVIIGDPIERELSIGVDDGEDIELLEQTLADLGYDADGDLEIDEVWDDATTDALTEWEDDLGWEADGILQLDQFVSVPEAGTVDTVEIERGDEIVRGTALVTTTEATRVVSTEIAVADQDLLPLGSTVDVEFPAGDVVRGTVSWVASSSEVPVGQPDADPVIPVEITLDSIPASAESFDELDVDVLLVDDIAQGVVTVPASAIISTGTAFAVEVVDGSTTRFVEVEPGMFADGWVEVTGIEAGTAVVVPS